MNKTEIIKRMAKQTHTTQEQASAYLDSFLAICAEALASGDKIQLTNFGTFGTHTRNERNSFDFAAGATKKTPAKRVVTFTPSDSLSERVKELK